MAFDQKGPRGLESVTEQIKGEDTNTFRKDQVHSCVDGF